MASVIEGDDSDFIAVKKLCDVLVTPAVLAQTMQQYDHALRTGNRPMTPKDAIVEMLF